MNEDKSITKWFGENLAKQLADKIAPVYPGFDSNTYCKGIARNAKDLGYTARIELHADMLRELLPIDFTKAINILVSILGQENPKETGMFVNFYWVMPIGKFIEKYGLDYFETSIKAIEEITKRNTGEYAIRPFLRRNPKKTITVMKRWSKSNNFHLRRLASEGSRPKLPWSTKLDTFINQPKPVFDILANLMEDEVKFVQKSVANNLTDYLKVNKIATIDFIRHYQKSENKNTQWILRHATRKIKI